MPDHVATVFILVNWAKLVENVLDIMSLLEAVAIRSGILVDRKKAGAAQGIGAM